MVEEKKNFDLYIPIQVPNQKQYISGIGKSEAKIIIMMFIISIFIGLFVFLITNQPPSIIMTMFLVTGLTVVCVYKDPTNENLIDRINLIRNYSKAQKLYEYQYINIYEGLYDEEKSTE